MRNFECSMSAMMEALEAMESCCLVPVTSKNNCISQFLLVHFLSDSFHFSNVIRTKIVQYFESRRPGGHTVTVIVILPTMNRQFTFLK